jgi:hypothetical protein
MANQTTISLRNDELEKIEWWMERYSMRRHEVIKLAIRSFLFPEEKTHRLNGITAEEKSVPNWPCHKTLTVTRSDGTQNSGKMTKADADGLRKTGLFKETDFVLSNITKTSKPSVTEGEE